MSADTIANNVAITFKRLYALVIAKELRFNSRSNNNKNGTYEKTNSFMKNDIINEHKEYLLNRYGIKCTSICLIAMVLNVQISFNVLDPFRCIKIQLNQDLLKHHENTH